MIRAGLILAMAILCYRGFAPFLPLMVWALVLAVTLSPLHQALASKIGGKQGLAATLLVVVGVVLIVVPTAMLIDALLDLQRRRPLVLHDRWRGPFASQDLALRGVEAHAQIEGPLRSG